ncbi:hypothetical protein [Lactobacillus sp. LL6]|uniref:hypothetical protein n=1 Tax=Lactobacillus sp. LL6 TaxID=2596827 RepID=UPI001184A3F4|nr:hypothetical protein [Lactobacillus sp. LL6]TSO26848.1 hypothetical protein FOD82_07445 [Lactobacillus sp. LL6]
MAELNFNYLKNNSIFASEYKPANKLLKLYNLEYYREVMINARLLAENIVKKIFDLENLNKYYPLTNGEERRTLRSNTKYLQTELDYPLSIINLLNEVRRFGNDAVHDQNYKFSKGQAWRAICDINDIFVFILNTYTDKKLYYMRPDIAMDAASNKRYNKRNIINSPKKLAIKKHHSEVSQARELVKNKKKHHFSSRLKKFLRKK